MIICISCFRVGVICDVLWNAGYHSNNGRVRDQKAVCIGDVGAVALNNATANAVGESPGGVWFQASAVEWSREGVLLLFLNVEDDVSGCSLNQNESVACIQEQNRSNS